MDINYDRRVFRGVVNYDDGDLNQETRFTYYQRGSVVWGTCEGGGVAFGTLVARVLDDGRLDMLWQYVAKDGRLVGGTNISTPEVLPNGRLRLHEKWRVTMGGDMDGESVVEEVKES